MASALPCSSRPRLCPHASSGQGQKLRTALGWERYSKVIIAKSYFVSYTSFLEILGWEWFVKYYQSLDDQGCAKVIVI